MSLSWEGKRDEVLKKFFPVLSSEFLDLISTKSEYHPSNRIVIDQLWKRKLINPTTGPGIWAANAQISDTLGVKLTAWFVLDIAEEVLTIETRVSDHVVTFYRLVLK